MSQFNNLQILLVNAREKHNSTKHMNKIYNIEIKVLSITGNTTMITIVVRQVTWRLVPKIEMIVEIKDQ
jgi:hypothetical protein